MIVIKLCKSALAALAASLLLGALAAPSVAARLSVTGQRIRTTWTRIDLRGAYGTVECELVLESTLHSRTLAKVAGTLIGTVTAANVPRCARGGLTILRETLPWHVQYAVFLGTLPLITHVQTYLIGMSYRVREPVFGFTCLVTSTTRTPTIGTHTLGNGGYILSVALSGGVECEGPGLNFLGEVSGTSSRVDNGSGGGITITLI